LESNVLEFLSAQSVDEALQALAHHGANATLMAGGTDVMIQLDRDEIKMGLLLHIERLNELTGIVLKNDRIEIGALSCHRDLTASKLLVDGYSSICSAAASVGGWQTQSTGTIGGNICNASPAADLIPCLLIHGAEVKLSSKLRGDRSMLLEDFLLGRRQTAREADELLTHISLESVPEHTADVYLKVGRRKAMEVAIVGLALRLTLNEDNKTIKNVRIASCATGPVSRRATEAENILNGQCYSTELIRDAGEALLNTVTPIDDVRGSAAYRLMVLPRLLGRAMQICKDKIEIHS
jgi:CO/xanthine dehydrogenase FAD-binding subunit